MAAQREIDLRQVREDEVDTLKERLSHHLPHSTLVYGALTMAVRYGLHSLRSASILVPACSRPSCFTVVTNILSDAPQVVLVFWSLEEHTVQDVGHLLSCIPDLDWNHLEQKYILPTTLLPSLQSLDIVGGRRVNHKIRRLMSVYTIQEPILLDTELPPGYYVTRLKKEDASVIWTHCDLKDYESEDSISHDIIHFPSVGIRDHGSLQDDGQDTLVSWIRKEKTGAMGNTFTLPQHRRRGLARFATLALAREMLQEGPLTYVFIPKSNIDSIKFHESLGFKRQCGAVMTMLVPAEATDKTV